MILLEIVINRGDEFQTLLRNLDEEDRAELLAISALPPFQLIEDVINYSYYKRNKQVLWGKMNYENYGRWMKFLSDGLSEEKIRELLKRTI